MLARLLAGTESKVGSKPPATPSSPA
jgi:hypothetical protein